MVLDEKHLEGSAAVIEVNEPSGDLPQSTQDGTIRDLCRFSEPLAPSANDEAFADLFNTYKDRVYSIAIRFSGDATAALDITQDTFLKLFSRIQDFRGESSFDSWLYRMVVNQCLDHHRRSKRWLPLLQDFENAVESFQLSRGHALPGSAASSALDTLLRAEIQTQVQSVIATLPADLRIIIVLRYTESLSYEHIAEIVNCPAGTVASRLNRAHKLLERRLAKLGWAKVNVPSGGGAHA